MIKLNSNTYSINIFLEMPYISLYLANSRLRLWLLASVQGGNFKERNFKLE